MTDIKTTSAGRRLRRVTDVMRILSTSRRVVYEQLKCERLRSVRQGRSRRIQASSFAEYLSLLELRAEQ
jgi:excisionase family DNA binding protein